MSVNLGSQKLSSTDRQATHMEPSSTKQNTMSVHLGSHQLSSAKEQSEEIGALPRLQHLPPSDKTQALSQPSNRNQSAIPINLGLQQLSSTNRQSEQTRVQAPKPVTFGVYPLNSTRMQSVSMEPHFYAQSPRPSYLGLPQLPSSMNRRPAGIHPSINPHTSIPLYMVSHSQSSSSTNKRPAQMEAFPKFQLTMPSNQGSLQQLPTTGKRSSQVELSPKVQTESFESVRLKLRESLASALRTVSEEKIKTEVVGKDSLEDAASVSKQAKLGIQPSELLPTVANDSVNGTSLESLTPVKSCQNSHESRPLSSGPLSTNENVRDKMDISENVELDDEVPFNKDSMMKDELLQGHGLCWVSEVDTENSQEMLSHDPKRPKLEKDDVTKDSKSGTVQTPENLATRIEAELFKLFGGVNKKYKEKGRSLLFNLKDHSNPELRERVLSGDIPPERLCSMTAEELASKELSEWRLAKAEELAHMVVLVDPEVDIRRLVRKTHKGEFQVEFEEDDSVVVEAGLDSGIPNEETQTRQKSNGDKDQESLLLTEKADLDDQNLSRNSEILSEKTDIMQEIMVDELRDTELLPPIVSLDEFMEALDKEPPFENLSMDNEQESPSSDENNSYSLKYETNLASDIPGPNSDPSSESIGYKLDILSSAEKNSDSLESENNHASDRPRPNPDSASERLEYKLDSPQDRLASKMDPENCIVENPVDITINDSSKLDATCPRSDTSLKSCSVHVQSDTIKTDNLNKSEIIWEGSIQLTISASAMALGFFRSGERTSTQEWPNPLEVKGRVRLDAFEKFLQELPLSRSRAIMISQFCWKEGSSETGRLNLCGAVNSYITDERVGFAEPAPGVELYLCPPHPKTTEMLAKHLPKDLTDNLHSAIDGLIGVVVWRRPQLTVSPRLSSHQKHKKQFSSRKLQTPPNSNPRLSAPSIITQKRTRSVRDESMDDIPPGFGPGVAREDDLPEFNFVHNSSQGSAHPVQGLGTRPAHLQPPHQVEQMRELIHKYGQSRTIKKPGSEIRGWNDDDDDDIPEWRPENNPPPLQQSLPPPPPPPPPQPSQQLIGYQQQTMQQQQQAMPQPFIPNQQLMLGPPQQQQQLLQLHAPPQQQQYLPMSMPMAMQPQMGMMLPGLQNVWQPAPMWPQGPAGMTLPLEGQFHGIMPGFMQNGMGWMPNNNSSGRGV